MSDQREKFWEELLVKTVVELVFFAGSTGAVAFWASGKISVYFSALTPYRTPLMVLAGVAGLYVGYIFFRKRSRNRPFFERIESDFIIEKLIITFTYNSPMDITYSRQYTIRPLKNGLDRITDTFRWSGKAVNNIRTKSSEHRVELQPDERLHRFFDLCFGRPYDKGDMIEAEVIWKLDDSDRTSSPFISRTIQEPTEKLEFIVDLSRNLGVDNVIAEIAPDAAARRNVKAKSIQLSEGRGSWIVPGQPKLLHHYQIRWKPKL
jgi:hypothetical protein